jgi:hypothetical protein
MSWHLRLLHLYICFMPNTNKTDEPKVMQKNSHSIEKCFLCASMHFVSIVLVLVLKLATKDPLCKLWPWH